MSTLLPTSILRSIIRFSGEDEEVLASNLYMLRQEIDPLGVDAHILTFVTDIHDRTKATPRIDLIETWATDKEDPALLSRLSELKTEQGVPVKFLAGPDFRYELDQFKIKLQREVIGSVLVEASSILSGGWRQGGKTIEGPEAARAHLVHAIQSLDNTLKRGSVEGSFRHDANKVRKQYDHWKAQPSDTVGVLTGIDRIDMVHRGARNGELCLVLGFVSHLKTTLCLNWLYKSAVLFGRNSAIASLETPIDILRMVIYVMHSNHQKFSDQSLVGLFCAWIQPIAGFH